MTKQIQRRAPSLAYDPTTKSVQDIVNYWSQGQLNLEPPFQRNSVWRDSDRSKLVDSLLNGMPVPSIYLAEREESGQIVYDVIDGKQRIESILMFMGQLHGRGRFVADVLWPGDKERESVSWTQLSKSGNGHALLSYRIPTHIVRGEAADIIELFVRINSTGKALTAAERRNARYNESPFLAAANSLARRFAPILKREHVLSSAQIDRMKHVELMCELMAAAHRGDVLNKKAPLDGIMQAEGSGALTARQIRLARNRTATSIKRLLSILPNARATRFRQLSDFYSLAVLLQKFEAEKLILTNRRRNVLAADLLTAFATGVSSLKIKVKLFQGATPEEDLYRDYAKTVAEGTDSLQQRRAREAILRRLLETMFASKDERRMFSTEQRRVLWNSTDEKKCVECKKRLTWDDFTVDHINPHSAGGRTALANAALMCRQHNSSKGNRR